jgi:hypothetical protein
VHDLFSPIVFGVAVSHAILVRHVEDRPVTGHIIVRPDPLRLAVHGSKEFHPIVDIAPFDPIVNMIGGFSS